MSSILFTLTICAIAYISVTGAQSLSSDPVAKCTPAPISAAIRNVSIANSPHNAVARGIAISVGNPAQPLAMMPYPWNNSFVYDSTNLCYADSDDNEAQCITRRGGAYSPFSSKTQKVGDPDATATDPSPYPSTSLYSDDWILNGDTALENFTFGVPLNDWGEQFYYPQSVVGLGPNSTFLNSLKAQDMIASRSWSFFWGQDGTGPQSNGSIVFGGYDQAKISGEPTINYTRKLNYTPDCMWRTTVEVPALSLFSYKGTTTALNVDTNGQETTLWTEFEGSSLMRSFGINFYDMLYLPNDTIYQGDIDFTIEGGPSVTVTNDQLVVPSIYMDDNGIWQTNSSQYDLLINEVSFDNTLKMGRHILSFMYVMINLDAGEFTVWPAATESNSESLVTVDSNNMILTDVTVCTTTTPGPSSVGLESSTGSAGTSHGAIAGIAIGAIALVGLVIAGAWFFLRRKRHQGNRAKAAEPPEHPPSYSAKPDDFVSYSEAYPPTGPTERNRTVQLGRKDTTSLSELGSTEARCRSELIGDVEIRHELA